MLVKFVTKEGFDRYIDSDHVVGLDFYDHENGKLVEMVTQIQLSNKEVINVIKPMKDVADIINTVKLETIKREFEALKKSLNL